MSLGVILEMRVELSGNGCERGCIGNVDDPLGGWYSGMSASCCGIVLLIGGAGGAGGAGGSPGRVVAVSC